MGISCRPDKRDWWKYTGSIWALLLSSFLFDKCDAVGKDSEIVKMLYKFYVLCPARKCKRVIQSKS